MLACGKDDVILSNLSLSHAYGFVCAMLWGLAYGATVALGRDVLRFTGDALFFKPTILPAVPSQIADMLSKDALNPELRVVLIGGAPCPKQLVDRLKEKGIDVYVGYGHGAVVDHDDFVGDRLVLGIEIGFAGLGLSPNCITNAELAHPPVGLYQLK